MKSPPPSTPQWRTPLIVFGVALLIRLAHVASIRRAPFFGLLLGDSKSYDLWAQLVAGGEWIGRDVFYQAPLYPYFLGTLYTVAGRSFAFVLFCQAVVGACSCALLADAGRRLFSPRAGLAAGLLLALYAPAIFFDGLIQKSVLDAFFLCLAIWMIARIEPEAAREVAHGPRGWARWGALGLALGGLALTRENALALVAVLAGWAIWREGPPRARLAHAAAFLGGVAIVLAPVAARNALVGGGFFVTTAQFGPNLYIGNHEGADGTYQALRYGRGVPEYEQRDATELAERALGRRLTPGEVSSYWRSRAIAFVVEQPGAWLRLMGRKAALLVNATEQIDTEDPAMYAEWSPLLRLLRPIGHFGVLLPLAVLGVAVTWSDRRRLAVLYALALTYSASVLAFYVFARYRYPLVPLLTLFAGAGIVGALDTVRARPARLSWATAATLAAALVFANWPMGSAAEMRAVAETNLGVALQDAGRADEAIEHHRRAIEALPDYASAYSNLGNALSDQGRFDEAVRAYREAIELEPDRTNAHYNLGTLLAEQGDPSSAIPHFEAALRVEPGSPAVHNNLGLALAGAGRADEAEAQFRQAIALDPASPAAWRNLGGALFTKGDGAGAIEAFRKAVELNPSDASARLDLATAHNAIGVALYEQGQVEEGIAELQRALDVRPDYEEARRNLAIMLERSGRR